MAAKFREAARMGGALLFACTVLKSGKRQLRNAAFLSGRTSSRNEPLAYEKALIDSWLDRDLPR